MRMNSTESGVEAIFLFIAELNGYKAGGTYKDKLAFGAQCYAEHRLHDLDWVATPYSQLEGYYEGMPELELDALIAKEQKRVEHDSSEAHVNIWLERLYSELEAYDSYKTLEALAAQLGEPAPAPHQWTVPIELDASALTK